MNRKKDVILRATVALTENYKKRRVIYAQKITENFQAGQQ